MFERVDKMDEKNGVDCEVRAKGERSWVEADLIIFDD